ncbi:MAG: glycine--tRNA ligase subunit beta, partial [Sphingobium sp.]|nr:glycine--tRNA ligase subunit beta [Sphingobium sp.]
SLADKLDTLAQFFEIGEVPSGSRDPFALRRAALSIIALVTQNGLRLDILLPIGHAMSLRLIGEQFRGESEATANALRLMTDHFSTSIASDLLPAILNRVLRKSDKTPTVNYERLTQIMLHTADARDFLLGRVEQAQRDTGTRIDCIRASIRNANDGIVETDLVRLLARVRALQAFIGTEDGANLLAGYKRAANILKKEAGEKHSPPRGRGL